MIDGISDTQLRRYLILRQRCDAPINNIQHLSSLFASFNQCEANTITLDPEALAHVHAMILSSVLTISEQLDEFIYRIDARQKLDAR